METFYLIIVVILFVLAISDLIVGVSNDAVNFLNSAVGSKAATFKIILGVAALGVLIGCTFSSGMMEVARKGIFHPGNFYFQEIILIFLAVMVTDVILLDAFNTLGMPTSTTVSIVFELLGAAVAMSLIKIYTTDTTMSIGDFINSDKALAIISGILMSVVIAFTAGLLIQYITRLLFTFDYEKNLKRFGAIWGGLAITAITYFILVKGAKGASFMSKDTVTYIVENTLTIILGSFVFWSIVLQLLSWFSKFNILKFIVLIGTFSLAMAFAGNDLVNFIGVPLAGYNSYELYIESGQNADLMMSGLAGKVPTPTLLLLIAGIIMTITLWTSKKARSVVQTSLDLGRQYEGSERFASYAISRSLVRNISKFSTVVNSVLPERFKQNLASRMDGKVFEQKQKILGKEAPHFDMIRAANTLVVASILIALGTNLKLPLSTTYVTFMVFMGTSLADGAWGRESAVYRVSGVLSVIGGWFFTAFSAFLVAFTFANIFYFGGSIAIVLVLIVAAILIYRTHRYHGKRLEEQLEFEKMVVSGILSREQVLELSNKNLNSTLAELNVVLKNTIRGLESEDLNLLNKTKKKLTKIVKKTTDLKFGANHAIDKIEDNELETGHYYILMMDYLNEMAHQTKDIVNPALNHVDNNHKPLLPEQFTELKDMLAINEKRVVEIRQSFSNYTTSSKEELQDSLDAFVKAIRASRKKQIKRIKNHEVGTRNSVLYFNFLGELRNLSLTSFRMTKVLDELIINPDKEAVDNQ